MSHGVVSILHSVLKRSCILGSLPSDVQGRLERRCQAFLLQNVLQHRDINEVLSALADEKVEAIVLKGAALGELLYPNVALRPSSDLDILCREEDWARVHSTLTGLGYTPERDYPVAPPKLTSKDAYYHMEYKRERSSGIRVEVHYDWLGLGLTPRRPGRAWQRAWIQSVADLPALVLSPEDQLISLCVHLGFHGYNGLKWYIDLALLLKRFGDKLDWDYVVVTAREEDVHLCLYYSLLYLEKLLGVLVPPQVLARLRPGLYRRWLHDRLWPPKEVLGLQSRSQPGFSFYFIPVMTRLVPNLLLMGRTWEKAAYLLRLLVPPRAWMAHYYGRPRVGYLYLTRPLRLFFYLLRELKQLARQGRPVLGLGVGPKGG